MINSFEVQALNSLLDLHKEFNSNYTSLSTKTVAFAQGLLSGNLSADLKPEIEKIMANIATLQEIGSAINQTAQAVNAQFVSVLQEVTGKTDREQIEAMQQIFEKQNKSIQWEKGIQNLHDIIQKLNAQKVIHINTPAIPNIQSRMDMYANSQGAQAKKKSNESASSNTQPLVQAPQSKQVTAAPCPADQKWLEEVSGSSSTLSSLPRSAQAIKRVQDMASPVMLYVDNAGNAELYINVDGRLCTVKRLNKPGIWAGINIENNILIEPNMLLPTRVYREESCSFEATPTASGPSYRWMSKWQITKANHYPLVEVSAVLKNAIQKALTAAPVASSASNSSSQPYLGLSGGGVQQRETDV